MPKLRLFCRVATTFARSGALDEDAFRRYLQRFVDAGIGVYLASAGSGEGNALTEDELRRVYRIGVEVCKGKVGANANPPETQTVRATREHLARAIESGVEMVNIYGPTGWHGFRPTDSEFVAFFDDLLGEIRHPVALAPNPTMGYTPKAALIADICNRYSQVAAVNLVGLNDDYFMSLKAMVEREVEYYVPLTGSLNTLALGAAGVIGGEFNILPKTFRRYVDCYEAGDLCGAGEAYAEIKRFTRYVAPWNSASPRWIKMAMKVLGLPGAEGGLREPYRMPEPAELRRFRDGLLRLGIPEIDALAAAAGASL